MSDVMTRDVVRVAPDATLGAVATALCENRVHRVLVIENDRLLGIISTFDLVGLLKDDPAQEFRSA